MPASFLLYLNNKQEIDKLQRLQNRCLRMCYNIHTPADIGTIQLHENARIDQLSVRRDLALLNIMYDLRQNNMYRKETARVTRANQGYIFDLKVPNSGVYAKSPYYIGANKWNTLPLNLQNNHKKDQFKIEANDILRNACLL